MTLLLLVTSHPRDYSFSSIKHAIKEHINTCEEQERISSHTLLVFFYSDGAYTANAFNWESADHEKIQQAWQALAKTYEVDLNVCVSTALSRGITNHENSKRHQLLMTTETGKKVLANNLAEGFQLVGLGVLAEFMHQADHIVHI